MEINVQPNSNADANVPKADVPPDGNVPNANVQPGQPGQETSSIPKSNWSMFKDDLPLWMRMSLRVMPKP